MVGATGEDRRVTGTARAVDSAVDNAGDDASHDVAVIQLQNASGLTVANLGNSSTVQVGDNVTGCRRRTQPAKATVVLQAALFPAPPEGEIRVSSSLFQVAGQGARCVVACDRVRAKR